MVNHPARIRVFKVNTGIPQKLFRNRVWHYNTLFLLKK